MHEFRVGEHAYRSNKMPARTQFHVARRIGPLFAQMITAGPVVGAVLRARQQAMEEGDEQEVTETTEAANNMLVPFARALAGMTDADCDYVLDRCMQVTQRAAGANGARAWSDIFNSRTNRMAFEDIDLMQMMQIAAEVLTDNLGGFFNTPLPGLPNLGSVEQPSSTA